jgi:hypothetical protein
MGGTIILRQLSGLVKDVHKKRKRAKGNNVSNLVSHQAEEAAFWVQIS